MKDNKNKKCTKPRCTGRYEERSIHDDIDGTLHCSKCGHTIARYTKDGSTRASKS